MLETILPVRVGIVLDERTDDLVPTLTLALIPRSNVMSPQANFAAEGKSTACFCAEHKSPGMVDVKGRRCTVPHCTKVATYGLLGHQPSACALHRGPGMVDMKQQRARLGGTKPGGISVKIGEAASGEQAGPTSFINKWGKRYRKNAFSGMGGIGIGRTSSDDAAPALGLDPQVDLLRPPRREPVPSLQEWYSGPVSSLPGPSIGQPNRPRGVSVGPLDAGSRRGISTSGLLTYDNQATGSPPSRTAGGNGGQQTSAQWQQSRGSGGDAAAPFPFSYPGSVGSGLLPGLQGRGGRLPGVCGSYGSGGGANNGGGIGGRAGSETWRLGVGGGHDLEDEPHQPSSPALLSGVEHHGYGMLSGLPSDVGSMHTSDVQGRGGSISGSSGVAAGPGAGNSLGNNSEMPVPDVESEDIWLRDLVQGAMPRENGSQHSSSPLDATTCSTAAESTAPGMIASSRSLGSSSGGTHYPRHLGLAPPSVSHTLGGRVGNVTQRSDRRSYHHQGHQRQQQQQQQQQQQRYYRQVPGANSPKMPRLPRVPYADAPPMVVRSPSTASNGATPPHDSAATDAISRGQLGSHAGGGGGVISSAGGGGGVSGIGDGGSSRAGTRGSSAPPSLNHLFMNLSSVSGCDGHGGNGLNTDGQFLPLPRVSSPGWGGM